MDWYISDVRKEEYPDAWKFGFSYYRKHLRFAFLFWELTICEKPPRFRRKR